MKKFRTLKSALGSLALAACVMGLALSCQGAMYPMPSENEAVDKAAGPSNLQATARETADPDVWLGLSFLPKPGDPVRRELSEMAVKAKPEYGPVAIVLANAMDGVSEESASELIRRDPENALGYYLVANRVYSTGTKTQSLETFRKGATCTEFRLYGATVSNILFKALDALNLKGRDRLWASSWMATRWQNFEIGNLQSPGPVLAALAKDADLETRKQISDVMLVVAGHLIGGDLETRVFGDRALQGAFHLKADIAASEKSPTMYGYAGVVQALVSTEYNWPGFKDQDPVKLAQFLPDRIWYAFGNPTGPKIAPDRLSRLSAIERPAFEKAIQGAARAAKAFTDAALPDQDEIIGACFVGRMPPRTNAPAPWAASPTYVERLMMRKPELFKALANYEEAGLEARLALERAVNAKPATASGAKLAANAAEDTCIYNLRRIDSAKQQWALEIGRQAEDTPTWADLKPYLVRDKNEDFPPKCPSGGSYTIGKVGEKPKCNLPGHVLP